MSSNKGKHLDVGEVFKDGDVELKVAKSTSFCKGCYYYERPEEECTNAPVCANGNGSVILNSVIFIRNE